MTPYRLKDRPKANPAAENYLDYGSLPKWFPLIATICFALILILMIIKRIDF